jgi:hypothetical protein
MAELQWIIEVKCINAFLGEVKVGEKGEYVIVNIPNRNFLPSELERLITAFEIAEKINVENRLTYIPSDPEEYIGELAEYVEVIETRNLANIRVLSTGEIVNIDVPERVFTPSEAHDLLLELNKVEHTMRKFLQNNH